MVVNLIGVDIGGTKCAVIYGKMEPGRLEIAGKEKFPTTDVSSTLKTITQSVDKLVKRSNLTSGDISAIGISCGGPLDIAQGLIMSPPNLPGWDNIPIVSMLTDKFGIKTAIENDANACALAEWKFGAGRGSKNMVFLTFGTGLGAGLIIDGRLYSGTNGNAGELGHIRLSDFGPVGYGKCGSFEGFCSGGGIAQLGRIRAQEEMQMGRSVSFCKSPEDLALVTAQRIAMAAEAGDSLAKEIFAISGRYLGKGLSVVIDILNPEVIVIGSIFVRSRYLLEPFMQEALKYDALNLSASVCRIVPAELDEQIGDYAALSVAANALTN